MSTLLERLRQHTRVDTHDGVPELIEEAAREIERLRVKNAELRQQLDAQRPYSSASWSDDA